MEWRCIKVMKRSRRNGIGNARRNKGLYTCKELRQPIQAGTSWIALLLRSRTLAEVLECQTSSGIAFNQQESSSLENIGPLNFKLALSLSKTILYVYEIHKYHDSDSHYLSKGKTTLQGILLLNILDTCQPSQDTCYRNKNEWPP
jgi:hypothetical protein